MNEHGVVQPLRGWEQKLERQDKLKPVTQRIRKQWSEAGQRTGSAAIARLLATHLRKPSDLAAATELASRYLELNLNADARTVLQTAVSSYKPRQVAQAKNISQNRLLGQAYFQLARAHAGNRKKQVEYATLSFYLNPSVGFGKQIARIIAPKKFDRPDGRFDNRFREGTLRRLRTERRAWLREHP